MKCVLDGQGVETVGQLAPDPDGEDLRLELYRKVTEDGKDSRYAIAVKCPYALPEYNLDAWYLIGGEMRYHEIDGETLPVLYATSLSETEEEGG